MSDVMSVARHLAALGYGANGTEDVDPLTPLRLQKLLYYVQGWSLALRGCPLFQATFQAWTHGPVVPEVYRRLKPIGRGVIEPAVLDAAPELDEEDRRFVEFVWLEYRQFSASALREKTHRELPWLEARGGLPEEVESQAEITLVSLASFFESEAQIRCKAVYPGLNPLEVWQGLREIKQGKVISHEELWNGLQTS